MGPQVEKSSNFHITADSTGSNIRMPGEKSLTQKKIVYGGGIRFENLGFGHFQRFFYFFFEWQKLLFILTMPSMAIVI